MQVLAERSAISVDQAREMFSGVTALSYDFGGLMGSKGHGTQIEYLSPDGSTYLWYPGNKRVVQGAWELRSDSGQTRMCFQYGPNTYNPVTQKGGGNWNCVLLPNYMILQIDRQKGDMFGLSEQTSVPYPLQRDAAKPYAPRRLPVDLPYTVDGKSVLEHIRDNGPTVGANPEG